MGPPALHLHHHLKAAELCLWMGLFLTCWCVAQSDAATLVLFVQSRSVFWIQQQHLSREESPAIHELFQKYLLVKRA